VEIITQKLPGDIHYNDTPSSQHVNKPSRSISVLSALIVHSHFSIYAKWRLNMVSRHEIETLKVQYKKGISRGFLWARCNFAKVR